MVRCDCLPTRAHFTRACRARPSVERVRDKAGIEVLDGDNGLGVVLGQIAMVRAVELARMYGIGAVSVRNSNHTGMLAAHLTPAIEASMIGFFTSTGPAIMAPWGGVEPRLAMDHLHTVSHAVVSSRLFST